MKNKVKLLKKVEELQEIMDKCKPFESSKIADIIDWKLLLINKCIIEGRKIKEMKDFLEQHEQDSRDEKIYAFWDMLYEAEYDIDLNSFEVGLLNKIEAFLFHALTAGMKPR